MKQPDLRTASPTADAAPWLTWVGLLLLVVLAGWGAVSVSRDRLWWAERTWVPGYEFLGVDFLANYHGARLWMAGGNPYQESSGAPLDARYAYPPLVLRLFAWCAYCPPWPATVAWMAALVVMAGIGARASGKARGRLGLRPLPLTLVVAATLGSTPVVYAVERGNCDFLVLMLLLGVAAGLRGRSAGHDVLTGACLALAAWLKIYPGLLLLGVLALRRWRAAQVFAVAAGAVAAADLSGTVQFVNNLHPFIARDIPSAAGVIGATTHTLTGCWPLFWTGTRLAWLNHVPGSLAWGCLFLPPLLAVSYRLARCPVPQAVVYPYLLWLAAAATFLPPVSNDYNLVFLPLAALAVWDRRDPAAVHVLLGCLLPWWQPVALPVSGKLLFAAKLVGLAGVGLCLWRRLAEQAQAANRERSSPPAGGATVRAA
jgi:hypothetical protein